MTFPGDFEHRIGFDRIRIYLRQHCLSQLGIELADQMSFLTDPRQIQSLLKSNREFLQLLRSGDSWPSSGYHDPSESFSLARVQGSILPAQAFLHIRLSLRAITEWLKFLETRRTDYPELFSASGGVTIPSTVVGAIDRALDEEGIIRDSATPELKQIRRSVSSAESEARKLIDRSFREAVAQGFTPDGASPVFREGRVAIPIKAEFKRKIKGIILDESATGQTIYIEPESLVEINNEIRDLRYEERREEQRILQTLTALLRENLSELETAFSFLAKMDFYGAKSRLSDLIDAKLPVLELSPKLKWRHARHPGLVLLKGIQQVVPMDIDLSMDSKFLLISGPNAGGKSVCLKTVGLLQYMVQCGLLPSVDGDSVFGIFTKVMVDIGDQQSIENDLSTYSSHLRNMTHFLQLADDYSLILIDEMGAGTDPAFGGGIAEAVLFSLVDAGAWGVVTTHYAKLKTLPERRAGIKNAAMLFDAEKLTPLFRMAIGKPGSSYAMELAAKSKLPSSIIKHAEGLIGSELVGLEALIRRTENEKLEIEKLKAELTIRERKLKEQVAYYEKLNTELEVRRKDILTKAKEEASFLLRETNREIEKTIRHIKENKAEKKETKKVRQKLTEWTDQVRITQTASGQFPIQFKEGQRVRLRGQDQSGVVLEVKGDKISVQFGILRSVVQADKLVPGDEQEQMRSTRISGIDLASRRSTFSEVLDLRGRRAEEVIPELESYLDNALLLGVPEVRIIHGKGEGVVRKMVRDHLKNKTQIAGVRDEHADRGGAGVTIVTMR